MRYSYRHVIMVHRIVATLSVTPMRSLYLCNVSHRLHIFRLSVDDVLLLSTTRRRRNGGCDAGGGGSGGGGGG